MEDVQLYTKWDTKLGGKYTRRLALLTKKEKTQEIRHTQKKKEKKKEKRKPKKLSTVKLKWFQIRLLHGIIAINSVYKELGVTQVFCAIFTTYKGIVYKILFRCEKKQKKTSKQTNKNNNLRIQNKE